MMRFRPHIRSISPALSILALAACVDRPPPVERAPPIAIDSAGVEIVASDPLNSDARCTLSQEPTLSIGTIEDDDPYLFFFIRGANRLSDGSIAVMDSGAGEVRIFSQEPRTASTAAPST